MKIHGIGIDLPAIEPNYNHSGHDIMLDRYLQEGWKILEISIDRLHLLIHGELLNEPTASAISIFRNYPFHYTVHGHMRLNLAYDDRQELVWKCMLSQIEFCRQVGADRLVIHSSLEALSEAWHGFRDSLPSDEELLAGERREIDVLNRLAPYAADAGVIICVENGDPHLWELNALKKFGKPAGDLEKYHGRLRIDNIMRQLDIIGHPNIGLCLDFAHLYLASNHLGDDFLTEVGKSARWLKHLHLSDNFGFLDRGFENELDRWPFGEADMHMPPGWGKIPYQEAFKKLTIYTGYAILEIEDEFRPYALAAVGKVRNWVDHH